MDGFPWCVGIYVIDQLHLLIDYGMYILCDARDWPRVKYTSSSDSIDMQSFGLSALASAIFLFLSPDPLGSVT